MSKQKLTGKTAKQRSTCRRPTLFASFAAVCAGTVTLLTKYHGHILQTVGHAMSFRPCVKMLDLLTGNVTKFMTTICRELNYSHCTIQSWKRSKPLNRNTQRGGLQGTDRKNTFSYIFLPAYLADNASMLTLLETFKNYNYD